MHVCAKKFYKDGETPMSSVRLWWIPTKSTPHNAICVYETMTGRATQTWTFIHLNHLWKRETNVCVCYRSIREQTSVRWAHLLFFQNIYIVYQYTNKYGQDRVIVKGNVCIEEKNASKTPVKQGKPCTRPSNRLSLVPPLTNMYQNELIYTAWKNKYIYANVFDLVLFNSQRE